MQKYIHELTKKNKYNMYLNTKLYVIDRMFQNINVHYTSFLEEYASYYHYFFLLFGIQISF